MTSPAPPTVPRQELQDRIDHLVLESLKPGTASLAAIYGLVAIFHLLFHSSHPQMPGAPLAVVMALFMVVLRLFLGRYPFPARHSHALCVVIGSLALGISLLHLHWEQIPLMTLVPITIALAAGFLFLSTRWLLAFLSLVPTGWLVVAHQHLRDPFWFWLMFCVIVSVPLSLTVHFLTARIIIRLQEAQLLEVHRQRELEGALQNLRRSNEDLQQFATVASHDLKEPLRTISGFARVLESQYHSQLDEQGREAVTFIREGAERMQAFIEGLLSYARATPAAQAGEPVACDMVLEEVLRNLKGAVAQRGAVIHREPLPEVAVNPTVLLELFQNLLSNALKFQNDSSPEVRVWAFAREGEWVFAVQDNGIGIAPEHHDRVFGLFQRLHSQDRYPGSGLGLSLCRKLVENQGGRIWLDSSPGRGTTFFFTLGAPTTVSEGKGRRPQA